MTEDLHMGEADSVIQNTENHHDFDHARFLHYDAIEPDGDYEHDKDYEVEIPEESDEDHEEDDATEIPIGFGEVFFIHEEVLRSTSRFFEAALREQWQEGTNSMVDLPEVDTEAFAIYTQWLYSGELHLTRGPEEIERDTRNDPAPIKTAEQRRWVACYHAGDYLQDPDFKDALIDAVSELWKLVPDDWPTFGLFFANIYNWSTVDSLHRRFVADMFVAGWCEESLVENIIKSVDASSNYAMMVPDILRAYSRAFIDEADPPCPWELEDLCAYHDHATDGGKCYRGKRGLMKVL